MSIRPFLLLIAVLGVSACKPSISEEDARLHGYCSGIFPFAEIAIERGWLRFPRGTFSGVQRAAERSFEAPVTWDEELIAIWRSSLQYGQHHGQSIRRGDIQAADLARLEECVAWGRGL